VSNSEESRLIETTQVQSKARSRDDQSTRLNTNNTGKFILHMLSITSTTQAFSTQQIPQPITSVKPFFVEQSTKSIGTDRE
jgi:iron uptake system EfeUOB component EfeO/EfeM